MKVCSVYLCLTFATLTLMATEEATPIKPGAQVDQSLPKPQDVVGFDFGEKISMHHEVMAYARALAAASPKVELVERGKTWEDRGMGLLFVSSTANLDKRMEFKERYRAIADPRVTKQSDFASTIEGLPVLVWLQESVHGNEISGTDSGLFLAWQLAAIQDPEIDSLLDSSILVIELMQNPDGRDRFISYARQHRSPGGDPDPQAAERNEPWPGGRYNHYLFDMNRDWISVSQPETKAKIAFFLDWFPQVTVDLHEMGSNSSFFAARPSPPANPLLGDNLLAAYEEFGRAIGKAFDSRGIDYFQGETFDSFYPGYGESWPSLHGAMGVLFEQGSARGLRFLRRDGTILTYRFSVTNQVLASYALLSHAAQQRPEILRLFYQNRKEAIELEGNQAVLLLPGEDPVRAVILGELLREQGIEVSQLKKPITGLQTNEGKTDIPKGSVLVRFDQPAGKLARSILSRHLSMGEAFTERQKERLTRLERPEIYDLTAWSLPLLYGVRAVFVPQAIKSESKAELEIEHGVKNAEARLGFLIPRDFSTSAVIPTLLRAGIHLHVADKAIHTEGQIFPAGSLIIKCLNNPEDLATRLAEFAKTLRFRAVGVDSSWFEKGPSFGSNSVRPILAPRVALVWNRPTAPMSAGWMRYLMEQRFQYPVTALNGEDLGGNNLSKYDVLLLPEGRSWGGVLGKNGTDKLKRWVADGGVLVGIGSTSEWLIKKDVGLLDTVREYRDGVVDDGKVPKPPKTLDGDAMDMITPLRSRPDRAYGALLQVAFNTDHWLAFGMNKQQAVLMASNRIMRPLRMDRGTNVGRYAAREALAPSGFVPEGTLDQLAHKPFVMEARYGRGVVIAFTEDPNYRAFCRGLEPLLANAVFLGPTRTR